MDKKKLEYFKNLLLEERKEVLEELMDSDESVKSMMEDELHNVVDAVDEASTKIAQNILTVMNKNNQQKILAIEAALRRVVENAFGICISCGNTIEENRLESIPWTTMCISCKRGNDKKR